MPYIPIIIAIVLLILAALIYYTVKKAIRYVKRTLHTVSRTAFNAASIMQGIEQSRNEQLSSKKSVSGMTRIYLPQIERDFPAFHYEACRQKAETLLKSIFLCLSSGDVQLLKHASDALKQQVSMQIEALRQQGIRAHYSDITIHQTEIAEYIKQNGRCVIVLQSAVGYVHYTTQNGTLVAGSKTAIQQEKYNIELHYVQNAEELADYAESRAIGLTCPNCGAPIEQLGQKACAYCGSGIIELNAYAWEFCRYEKI